MELSQVGEQWQGRWVYCRLTTGEWRRGKVRFVSDDGFVYVDIFRSSGESNLCFGYPVHMLAQTFRLA